MLVKILAGSLLIAVLAALGTVGTMRYYADHSCPFSSCGEQTDTCTLSCDSVAAEDATGCCDTAPPPAK